MSVNQSFMDDVKGERVSLQQACLSNVSLSCFSEQTRFVLDMVESANVASQHQASPINANDKHPSNVSLYVQK